MCLLLFAGGCTERLPWRSDYQAAMAEARSVHAPAILMFSASMCPHCWKMDREVFTDPDVQNELADYQLIRLDIFTHRKLARQYEFRGTPAFVVFDGQGRAIGATSGAMTPKEFVVFLRRSRLNR